MPPGFENDDISSGRAQISSIGRPRDDLLMVNRAFNSGNLAAFRRSTLMPKGLDLRPLSRHACRQFLMLMKTGRHGGFSLLSDEGSGRLIADSTLRTSPKSTDCVVNSPASFLNVCRWRLLSFIVEVRPLFVPAPEGCCLMLLLSIDQAQANTWPICWLEFDHVMLMTVY